MPFELRDSRNLYNPKYFSSFSSLESQPKQCKLLPPKPVNSYSSTVIFDEKLNRSNIKSSNLREASNTIQNSFSSKRNDMSGDSKVNTGLPLLRQSDLSIKSNNQLNTTTGNVEKVSESVEKESNLCDSSRVKTQTSVMTSRSKANLSNNCIKESSSEGRVENCSLTSSSPQVEKESDHTAPSTSLTQALLGSVSLGPTIVIRSLTSDQKTTCQQTVSRTWCKPPTPQTKNHNLNKSHNSTMFRSSLQLSSEAENSQFPRVDEVAHFKNDAKTSKGNRFLQDIKKTYPYVPTEGMAKLNTSSSYAFGKKFSPGNRLQTSHKQFQLKTTGESDAQKERNTEFYENFSRSFSFQQRLPAMDQFVLPCHLNSSTKAGRLSNPNNLIHINSQTVYIPTIPKLSLSSSTTQDPLNEKNLTNNENVKGASPVSNKEKNLVEASTQTTLYHCKRNDNFLACDILAKQNYNFQRETVCRITTNGFHGSLISKESDFLVHGSKQGVMGGAFEKKKSIEGYQVASEQNNVFEATESNNTKCRLSSNHSNNSISETSLCNDINSPFPPTKVNQTYTPAKVHQEFNFLSDINKNCSSYFHNNYEQSKENCLNLNVTYKYKALSDELYKNQGKANYTATFQNKVTDFYKKEFSAVDTLNSNSKDVLQKSSSRDLQNKTYNAPYRKSDKNFESANNTLNSCDTSVLLKSGPHVSNMTIPSHKMSVQPHLPLNNYHSHRNYHFQQPCNKSFVLLDVNKKQCRYNNFSNAALTKNEKEMSDSMKLTPGKPWNQGLNRSSNPGLILKSNDWKPAKTAESKIMPNNNSINSLNYNMEFTSPLYSSNSYAVNPVRYVSNKI